MYIHALDKNGQGGVILDKLAKLSPNTNLKSSQDGNAENFWLETGSKTDAKKMGEILNKVRPDLKSNAKPLTEPLHVILTKKTSWGEFLFGVTSRLFLAIAAICGVSYILNQQGVLKSAMSSGEIQPVSTENKIRFKDVVSL
jgi:hypothetical protein